MTTPCPWYTDGQHRGCEAAHGDEAERLIEAFFVAIRTEYARPGIDLEEAARNTARARRDLSAYMENALMIGGLRGVLRKPCLMHAGEHTAEECYALARAEKAERALADRTDCHAGPGTTEPACGACITCLNRALEAAEAARDNLHRGCADANDLAWARRSALEDAARFFDGSARDAARKADREYAAKVAAVLRSMITGGRNAKGDDASHGPATGPGLDARAAGDGDGGPALQGPAGGSAGADPAGGPGLHPQAGPAGVAQAAEPQPAAAAVTPAPEGEDA